MNPKSSCHDAILIGERVAFGLLLNPAQFLFPTLTFTSDLVLSVSIWFWSNWELTSLILNTVNGNSLMVSAFSNITLCKFPLLQSSTDRLMIGAWHLQLDSRSWYSIIDSSFDNHLVFTIILVVLTLKKQFFNWLLLKEISHQVSLRHKVMWSCVQSWLLIRYHN